MPPRSELPGSISRPKFVRALKRVGFNIDTRGGKGSHIKVVWPKSGKIITIQGDIRKDVLYELLKDVKSISGITWEDIRKKL